MNKLECFLMVLLTSAAARAERGVNVDVTGFMDSVIETVVSNGSRIGIVGVVLTCVGLMIPGFREVTRRSLPWTIMGILGIILVTKYWR
jgi:hypothetical protein